MRSRNPMTDRGLGLLTLVTAGWISLLWYADRPQAQAGLGVLAAVAVAEGRLRQRRLADRIVTVAAWFLPAAIREDNRRDWRGHVADREATPSPLDYALSIAVNVPRIAVAYSRPQFYPSRERTPLARAAIGLPLVTVVIVSTVTIYHSGGGWWSMAFVPTYLYLGWEVMTSGLSTPRADSERIALFCTAMAVSFLTNGAVLVMPTDDSVLWLLLAGAAMGSALPAWGVACAISFGDASYYPGRLSIALQIALASILLGRTSASLPVFTLLLGSFTAALIGWGLAARWAAGRFDLATRWRDLDDHVRAVLRSASETGTLPEDDLSALARHYDWHPALYLPAVHLAARRLPNGPIRDPEAIALLRDLENGLDSVPNTSLNSLWAATTATAWYPHLKVPVLRHFSESPNERVATAARVRLQRLFSPT